MAVPLVKHRFTVEEFHRMVQAGIFSEDDRVELLEGEIVDMVPAGSEHAACVDRLNRHFSLKLGGRAIVRVQSPIRLEEHSQPQPDLALLVPRADFYATEHPGLEDVLLLVEVAESSAGYDREVKLPLYARAGIPEVWVVDLGAKAVEVYRAPALEGYREVAAYRSKEAVAPQAFPEAAIPLSEVFYQS